MRADELTSDREVGRDDGGAMLSGSDRGPTWVAGVVHHDAWADLPACLESVARQTLSPAGVSVIDTGTDCARLEAMQRAFPEVRFRAVDNRGYGAGANGVLADVDSSQPDVEFVLILNPDVELDTDFAEVLLLAMQARTRVALASGKLLRPGREMIDSAGIRMPRHRRARDRGSQVLDKGQFDQPELVFGVSGAAMMIRRTALADLTLCGEVFDEDFFAYQDDTDLSWRAGRLGWEVLYEPAAQAVHGRGWQSARRMSIHPGVRRHSFKNHYLQLVKNERFRDLLLNLPWLLSWELLRFGFALMRDRAVLPAYIDAARHLPRAWTKRRALTQREQACQLRLVAESPAHGELSAERISRPACETAVQPPAAA